MRTGHLFAGAGGGILADLILGHEPQFAVEWDDYAAQILRERINDGWFADMYLHHGDVRLFDPSDWKGRVDSLHAGFPCTDISVAGKGAGIEGQASGLWSEVVRVADEIQPAEIFLENSPAIVNRGLVVVLSDLAALGFDARWCVLPASAVGAPHLRARWWCLARRADANSKRREEQRQPKPSEAERSASFYGGVISHAELIGPDAGETLQPRRSLPNSNGNGTPAKPERNHVEFGVAGGGWWSTEPGLGRMAHGLAARAHRLKALGNGQVPIQAAAAYMMLDGLWAKERK